MGQSADAISNSPLDGGRAVAAYFDDRSEYWRHIYGDASLEGEIYRGRQAAVLELVAGLQLPRQSSVLEVGCGAGLLTIELGRRGLAVDAIDASPRMVGLAREAVSRQGADPGRVRLGSADSLPYPNGAFQLVVAVGVLPWLSQPREAVLEMARVTRQGGHVILSADNRARLSAVLDPWLHPRLQPAKARLRRRAAAAGIWPAPGHTDASLHDRGFVDAVLLESGLQPIERRTVGFGPFSLFRSALLPTRAGIGLNRLLQRLADRGRAGLRWRGAHYIVMAERRPRDARS